MMIFRCKPYIYIPSDEQNKLNPKSIECIFRFEKGVKEYKLWDPKNKKKLLSRVVILMNDLESIILIKKRFMKRTILKFLYQKDHLFWIIMLRRSKHLKSMKLLKRSKCYKWNGLNIQA